MENPCLEWYLRIFFENVTINLCIHFTFNHVYFFHFLPTNIPPYYDAFPPCFTMDCTYWSLKTSFDFRQHYWHLLEPNTLNLDSSKKIIYLILPYHTFWYLLAMKIDIYDGMLIWDAFFAWYIPKNQVHKTPFLLYHHSIAIHHITILILEMLFYLLICLNS